MQTAFRLLEPQQPSTSVLFSSPHSGSHYPEAFMRAARLNARDIRSSEDAYVDQLFETVPQFGAYLLAATLPRAYVDLNRAEGELDPALIEGARVNPLNPRVASGLGIIPRVVAEGKVIHAGKITMEEAQKRIALYYRPYHTRLQMLMRQLTTLFGEVTLIDCHSMPSESVSHVRGPGGMKPDIVLGNRFGATCNSIWMDRIEEALTRQGFVVGRNVPFAGAYIVQTYGKPSIGRHAVQIEIDRSIYMDEETLEPLPIFAEVKRKLHLAVAEICALGSMRQGLAAE